MEIIFQWVLYYLIYNWKPDNCLITDSVLWSRLLTFRYRWSQYQTVFSIRVCIIHFFVIPNSFKSKSNEMPTFWAYKPSCSLQQYFTLHTHKMVSGAHLCYWPMSCEDCLTDQHCLSGRKVSDSMFEFIQQILLTKCTYSLTPIPSSNSFF